MTDAYDEYVREYLHIYRDLKKRVEFPLPADEGQKKEKLLETTSALKTLEQLISKMKYEADKLSPKLKVILLNKISEYQFDLDRLQSELLGDDDEQNLKTPKTDDPPKPSSPQTPKSYFARFLGPPIKSLPKLCCISPSVKQDSPHDLLPQPSTKCQTESSTGEIELTSLSATPAQSVQQDVPPAAVETIDYMSPMSELPNQTVDLASDLKVCIQALTTTVNSMLAEDPLKGLRKEQEDLTRFILVVGALSTSSALYNPPGGLDSQGYIRFRSTLLFVFYAVFSELSFFASWTNFLQMQRPLAHVEDKAKELRTRIKIGWCLLWVSIILFFGSYVLAFWIVYPGDQLAKPVRVNYNTWPRWSILGFTIAKVLGSLVWMFWAKLRSFLSSCFQVTV